MQFKPELIEKILSGQKTQTRRPVKPGETLEPYPLSALRTNEEWQLAVFLPSGQVKWGIGRTYAVCPGRGKKQVARIRVLDRRREDVRNISEADAMAEGFSNDRLFLMTWCEFYDPRGLDILNQYSGESLGILTIRPDHLYDAWALTFELAR
jgi:hypothetical protein